MIISFPCNDYIDLSVLNADLILYLFNSKSLNWYCSEILIEGLNALCFIIICYGSINKVGKYHCMLQSHVSCDEIKNMADAVK